MRRRRAGGAAGAARLARAVVEHHKAYRVFRRSLRQLSVENDVVRAARARSRLNQVEYVKNLTPTVTRDDASIATMLLQTERLAHALAEGEFQDMGLSEQAGEAALARLIQDLLSLSRIELSEHRSPDTEADLAAVVTDFERNFQRLGIATLRSAFAARGVVG